MAVSHFAASLELSVNVSQHGTLVQSVLLFLYPIAYAFVGVGAVVDHRWMRRGDTPGAPELPLRLAGLALLAFFLLALTVNGLTDSAALLAVSVAASAITLSGWYLLLGVALSQQLSVVKAMGTRALAQGWALHLAGLLAGYALNRTLIMDVGVNALLFCLGLSLMVLPRLAAPVFGLLVLLANPLQLDARLEPLRNLSGVQSERALGYSKMSAQPGAGPGGLGASVALHGDNLIHTRWSPFALFMLSRQPSATPRAEHYSGIYNFKHQWDVTSELDTGTLGVLKTAAYSVFEPDDQVMIIGAGGGRGLTFLSIPPHPGVVAVERDPAVVELFRDLRPALNQGLYQQVTAVAADGRYAAETWPIPLDFLVIESARYQPLMPLCSASSPYYLFTREAMEAYLDALAPGGVLMVNFNRTGPGNDKNYLAMQIMRALRGLGASVEAVGLDRSVELNGEDDASYVYILASRDQAAVHRTAAAIMEQNNQRSRARKGKEPVYRGWEPTLSERFEPIEHIVLSDDRPFLGWFLLGPRGHRTMYAVSALILALAGLGAWALRRRPTPEGAWDPVPYFVLIGLAHTGLQVASFYGWRSYFGDEISTMSRLLLYFLGFGALGSALAERYRAQLSRRGVYLTVSALALALTALGLVFIPSGSDDTLLRESYALVATAPGGLLMGTFFPMGAMRVHPRLLGRALMADALGVLACYALFFLVFLTMGRWVFLALACLLYLASAALIGSRGSGQQA